MSRFQRVGVVGAGLMGSGIAQTTALAGYPTDLRDVDDAALDRGRQGIQRSLGKLVEKGMATAADRDAALARLSFTKELGALASADLVIEAVTEDPALKGRVYADLDALSPPATIFATNTSSLVVAELAGRTSRPDRFVGLHFFNPVPLMGLVEVVRSLVTSEDTVARAVDFVRSLGKEPVIARDASGFIVNRLLIPYMLDAVRAVEQGVASTADLDTAMRLGAGHPMGPLTLLDLVGLDTACLAADHMYEEYREMRFAPPPLLRRMVAAGRLGRKTGEGFYRYDIDPPVPSVLGL